MESCMGITRSQNQSIQLVTCEEQLSHVDLWGITILMEGEVAPVDSAVTAATADQNFDHSCAA